MRREDTKCDLHDYQQNNYYSLISCSKKCIFDQNYYCLPVFFNPLEENKHCINPLLLIGGALLAIPSLLVIITSICFILNIPITQFHFPIACILSITGIYFFYTTNHNVFINYILHIAAPALLLVTGALFCAGSFYDLSFDGQWYHQEAVLQLLNGWNPFNSALPTRSASISDAEIWVNHYPQGAWYAASCIVSFIEKIEQGKAVNFILLISSIFIVAATLKELGIKNSLAWLFAILIGLNPVTIYQMCTFYVDTQVASCISIIVALCILIMLQQQRFYYLLLFLISIYAINLKFTSAVYVTILWAGLFIYQYIKQQKSSAFFTLKVGCTTFLLAIIVVGYGSFVKNTLTKQHPFYPVMGPDNVGHIVARIPMSANFIDKNRFEKMAMSTFAIPTFSRAPLESTFKIPFTKMDLMYVSQFKRPDSEMSGFGPFYAEIFILILILLFLIIGKIPRKARWILGYIALVICISVFINPEAYYARYAPQFYLIPICIYFCSFLAVRSKALYTLQIIIGLLFIYNAGAIIYVNTLYQNTIKKAVIDELTTIKSSEKTVLLYTVWSSSKRRLEEAGIRYQPAEATVTLENNLFSTYNQTNYTLK